MKTNFYLRINGKEVSDTSGIETALNCITLSDEDKQSIKSFISSLGYTVVDVDGEYKIYAPKRQTVFSTWDVRAESKRLIAYDDLKDICQHYLGKELDQAYNDAEINEILYMATKLPSYSIHRTEAVKEAFFMFVCGKEKVKIFQSHIDYLFDNHNNDTLSVCVRVFVFMDTMDIVELVER